MQLIVQKCDLVDISTLEKYLDLKDLPLFLDNQPVPEAYEGLILLCEDQGISLKLAGKPAGNASASPTKVDFTSDAIQYRLNTSKRSEGLLKAVGMDKYAPGLQVLDITAGLGIDAYIMAAMGCKVTLLEKSGIMAVLLDDGLKRGLTCSDARIRSHIQRMTLRFTDAQSCLNQLKEQGDKVDVIYLDPMFPPRVKTAKVKKDMALMQALLPPNNDVEQLLDLALACAGKRVVLKRPGKSRKNIGKKSGKAGKAGKEGKEHGRLEPVPDFNVPGKACHFEVYLIT